MNKIKEELGLKLTLETEANFNLDPHDYFIRCGLNKLGDTVINRELEIQDLYGRRLVYFCRNGRFPDD